MITSKLTVGGKEAFLLSGNENDLMLDRSIGSENL